MEPGLSRCYLIGHLLAGSTLDLDPRWTGTVGCAGLVTGVASNTATRRRVATTTSDPDYAEPRRPIGLLALPPLAEPDRFPQLFERRSTLCSGVIGEALKVVVVRRVCCVQRIKKLQFNADGRCVVGQRIVDPLLSGAVVSGHVRKYAPCNAALHTDDTGFVTATDVP